MRVRFSINFKINRRQISGIDGDLASPKRHQKVSKFAFFSIKFLVTFKKISAVKGLTSVLWKLFLLPKWHKWSITPIYFTFQQTYWVHVFSKCLSNPLTQGDGYIRHFSKILPFILKTRVLLLSLHLYTKRICGFDSALTLKQIGAK